VKNLRSIALHLWEKELGKPYRWGGDDPIGGFDCSGLVIEHLKSVGILPAQGDWTAAGLAKRFEGREVTKLRPGCLLFWFRGQKIGHVEIVWHVVGERILTIGAAGGGSRTQTEADAERQNAYIKVRPARPEWVKAVDPFVST
jgi:hypothetical protein